MQQTRDRGRKETSILRIEIAEEHDMEKFGISKWFALREACVENKRAAKNIKIRDKDFVP